MPWFRPWNQFFNRNFTSRNFLGSTSFWCWIRQNFLWLRPRFSKYADRINGCSGILKFGVNPDQGKLVLKQAYFCRVRHCPVCQWRRSLLWRAVMFQQLPKIQELYPTHRWVFLTLTVKNPPVTELRDTLKHMNDSWQRLIQTKRFKSGVAGFLRTTEVTRGNDGKWWRIRISMLYCWLSLVILQRDISSNLIGSKCGRKPCEQTICRRSTWRQLKRLWRKRTQATR